MRRGGAAHPAMRVPAQAPAAIYADGSDADIALTALYGAHYRALVRVAFLLVGSGATAEQIVQESFAAMNASACAQWNTGRALSHLRAAVVSRSRSVSRHHVEAQTATGASDMADATCGEPTPPEQAAIMAALLKLPNRQREAVVLRCYCDLSDAQIAATMGISARAVRQNASRGMAALHPVLEGDS